MPEADLCLEQIPFPHAISSVLLRPRTDALPPDRGPTRCLHASPFYWGKGPWAVYVMSAASS